MKQAPYNLFNRQRVGQEYARLYDDLGLGLITWNPLASGLLTGKYRNSVSTDRRGALEVMSKLTPSVVVPIDEVTSAKAN